MLNPRSHVPIPWESTSPERLSRTSKAVWESRSVEFGKRRNELVDLVRQGEMTIRAAKNRSAELAEEMRNVVDSLVHQERSYTPTLSKSLTDAEKKRLKPLSPELAQQRTMDLLMHNLTELRIANRKEEFEARTFVRATTQSSPAPSVEKLFEFLDEAIRSDDAAAAEWTRRQLERMREFVPDEQTRERIDMASDRPGFLNRRLVTKYKESISERLGEKGFVEAVFRKAIDVVDANACAAIFEIARRTPEVLRPETIEAIASNADRMPDQAYAYARYIDRETRREEKACLDRFAESSLAWIEQMSSLADVRQPTEAELRIADRSRNIASSEPDVPVGLIPVSISDMNQTRDLVRTSDESVN